MECQYQITVNVQKLGQKFVCQFRGKDLQIGYSANASAHAEVSAGFEIQGSRRNEIFCRQAAVNQAVIAEVEWLPGICIKRVMHDL